MVHALALLLEASDVLLLAAVDLALSGGLSATTSATVQLFNLLLDFLDDSKDE